MDQTSAIICKMAPNQAWVEIGCVDMEQDREMRFWNPVENLSLKHDDNAL